MSARNESSYPGSMNNTRIGWPHPSRILSSTLTTWFSIIVLVSVVGAVFSLILLLVMLMQRPLLSKSVLLLFHLVLLEFVICAILNPMQHVASFRNLRGDPSEIDCGHFMVVYVTCVFTGYWNAIMLAIVRFLAATSNVAYKRVTTR
ncbi:hypothetical protein RvY_19233 [Ramazzottius varieornatus]|uniref:G-protein coupled receptors family 1 profile domain-containing protein n=1 Tax=Ramazzottius varieornatus TaxID=947166 RepID=A0A1D1W8Q3_RAMVA|nr:hypothetical protein RvY_19233 [Ramazzottius varieornatus]